MSSSRCPNRSRPAGPAEQGVSIYDLLFRAACRDAADDRGRSQHLGAEIGFFAVLHTWGQNLLQNPHS